MKKIYCPTFFCSHKNQKNKNYINIALVNKKIWANLQRIIELSTQKTAIALKNIVLGPEIRKKPIPDP